MSALRYLLDENVDALYHVQLLRREPALVVWRVGTPGAPRPGTSDPELLDWCEKNSFVLVTNDRRTIPAHVRDHLAGGKHLPGVVVLSRHSSVGHSVEDLLLIWAALDSAELRDRIVFLPVAAR